MKDIENLSEAKAAVAALSQFLDKFEKSLSVLGNLTGISSVSGVSARIKNQTSNSQRPAPATMPERVIQILAEAGKPLPPKALVADYEARGWPIASKEKAYATIMACAYYLIRKQKVVKSSNGEYSLPG